MSQLSLYMNPAGKVVVHRTGFSWLAALALPLWALHRRQYVVAIVLLPLTALLHNGVVWAMQGLAGEMAGAWLALLWLVGWSVLAGRIANRAHHWLLARRGYFMTATELPAQAPSR